MNIRQALRKHSELASGKRGKDTGRWCGSTAILAMTAALVAIVGALQILHG